MRGRSGRPDRQRRVDLALVTALFLAASSRLGQAQLPPQAPPLQALSVNGTVLHYVAQGSGTPVVFVHGGLGDYRTFQPQFEALASTNRVVAYSRRYHPPNEIPAGTAAYSFQVHVDDLAALITTLRLAPAHVVGHSYGAYVSLALALKHPELVRSLVLGEPPVLSLLEPSSVGRGLLSAFRRKGLPTRTAFQAGDVEGGLRGFIDAVFGAGAFDRMPPDARQRVMTFGPEMRLEMTTDPSVYMTALDCGTIARLQRPVLLVTGDRSEPMLQGVAMELERCLQGETHVTLPDADHSLHRRDPGVYLEALRSFLRQ
jgi:non-heme chloroperoxidase